MEKIKEATKNFFVCGILMLIAGTVLILISKFNLGVLAIVCGGVFIAVGVAFLVKDLKES